MVRAGRQLMARTKNRLCVRARGGSHAIPYDCTVFDTPVSTLLYCGMYFPPITISSKTSRNITALVECEANEWVYR